MPGIGLSTYFLGGDSFYLISVCVVFWTLILLELFLLFDCKLPLISSWSSKLHGMAGFFLCGRELAGDFRIRGVDSL